LLAAQAARRDNDLGARKGVSFTCSRATKELTVRRMNYGVFELRAVSRGEFEALKRFRAMKSLVMER
jgi:hypothetical protein